jgi:hypothetical protein
MHFKIDVKLTLFLLIVAILIGYYISYYNKKAPEIKGMNYSLWKNDKYGCKSDRENLVDLIISNRDKFLKYNQNQIINILGKPENQTLYERGQKFFYYYVKYHPECDKKNALPEEEQIKLEIRFDALNRSKEIFVYNL